jgi:hypothetical protein
LGVAFGPKRIVRGRFEALRIVGDHTPVRSSSSESLHPPRRFRLHGFASAPFPGAPLLPERGRSGTDAAPGSRPGAVGDDADRLYPAMNRIAVDRSRSLGALSPHVFGGFVEHLGRCTYGGVYEEGSLLADERGLRRDVLDLLRPLRISVLR